MPKILQITHTRMQNFNCEEDEKICPPKSKKRINKNNIEVDKTHHRKFLKASGILV